MSFKSSPTQKSKIHSPRKQISSLSNPSLHSYTLSYNSKPLFTDFIQKKHSNNSISTPLEQKESFDISTFLNIDTEGNAFDPEGEEKRKSETLRSNDDKLEMKQNSPSTKEEVKSQQEMTTEENKEITENEKIIEDEILEQSQEEENEVTKETKFNDPLGFDEDSLHLLIDEMHQSIIEEEDLKPPSSESESEETFLSQISKTLSQVKNKEPVINEKIDDSLLNAVESVLNQNQHEDVELVKEVDNNELFVIEKDDREIGPEETVNETNNQPPIETEDKKEPEKEIEEKAELEKEVILEETKELKNDSNENEEELEKEKETFEIKKESNLKEEVSEKEIKEIIQTFEITKEKVEIVEIEKVEIEKEVTVIDNQQETIIIEETKTVKKAKKPENPQKENKDIHEPIEVPKDQVQLLKSQYLHPTTSLSPLKKNPKLAQPSKKVEFKDWWLKKIETASNKIALPIVVEGIREKNDGKTQLWHSSLIHERVDPKIIKSASGTLYYLTGDFLLENSIQNGLSKKCASTFKNGFPIDWKEVLEKEIQKKVAVIDKKLVEEKPEPKRGKKVLQRTNKKKEVPKTVIKEEVIIEKAKHENVTKEVSPEKKEKKPLTNKKGKTEKKKSPDIKNDSKDLMTDQIHSKTEIIKKSPIEENPFLDPILNISSKTRSGRRIKPPNPFWFGNSNDYIPDTEEETENEQKPEEEVVLKLEWGTGKVKLLKKEKINSNSLTGTEEMVQLEKKRKSLEPESSKRKRTKLVKEDVGNDKESSDFEVVEIKEEPKKRGRKKKSIEGVTQKSHLEVKEEEIMLKSSPKEKESKSQEKKKEKIIKESPKEKEKTIKESQKEKEKQDDYSVLPKKRELKKKSFEELKPESSSIGKENANEPVEEVKEKLINPVNEEVTESSDKIDQDELKDEHKEQIKEPEKKKRGRKRTSEEASRKKSKKEELVTKFNHEKLLDDVNLWTVEEDSLLEKLIWTVDPRAKDYWLQISVHFPNKTEKECQERYQTDYGRQKENPDDMPINGQYKKALIEYPKSKQNSKNKKKEKVGPDALAFYLSNSEDEKEEEI